MAMSPAIQVVEQAPTPAPPLPPAAPIPPLPPSVVTSGQGGNILELGRLSARDVAMLRQRGRELSNQLVSANTRRDELARALETADGVNKAGLEQRIAQLDQRIMTIEAAIAENGRFLASAPVTGQTGSTGSPSPGPLGLNPGQITGITIVGTIFVLFPLALAAAWNLWKRGSRAAVAPAAADAARMERLEQAVDAIAIEVERVSEGQRYVTRLLTEGGAPALAVGQRPAESVRIAERDPIRASRETA
jgi:hypothetical protein